MKRITTLTTILTMTAMLFTPKLSPAQTDTTFTYQGQLNETGAPADGDYHLDFSLWDSLAGGAQIGDTVHSLTHPVSEGLFTIELDFGADAFTGAQRWLEITVNEIILAPRTPITRSPYSIQTRGIFVDDLSRVGIGTTSPERTLDILGGDSTLRITSFDDSPNVLSTLQFKRALDAMSIFSRLGTIEFINLNDEVEASITATRAGMGATTLFHISVGVGNTTPQLTITPEDGVVFGPHAIRPALAYGVIDGEDGSIRTASASVLSVVRTSIGNYTITYEGGVDTDVVVASLEQEGFITARMISGTVKVITLGNFTNHPNFDRDFSFVVYRP